MEKLFEPLGILEFAWEKDPQGNAWGGHGLQITARDLAAIGNLFLNNGEWNGRQVVPDSWVEKAKSDTGISPVAGVTYSNCWIQTKMEIDNSNVYFGIGYGGQALVVIPHRQMVIVVLQRDEVGRGFEKRQTEFLDTLVKEIYKATQ